MTVQTDTGAPAHVSPREGTSNMCEFQLISIHRSAGVGGINGFHAGERRTDIFRRKHTDHATAIGRTI